MRIKMKNIARYMIFAGNKLDTCNHYCNNMAKKGNFYHWYSYLGNNYLKQMCEKCAKREVWGTYFKSNRHYKKWECSQ